MTQGNPDGGDATTDLYWWIGLRAADYLLMTLNNVLISYIQHQLNDDPIGNKALEKIRAMELISVEKHLSSAPSLLARTAEDTNTLLTKIINEFGPLIFNLFFGSLVLYAAPRSFLTAPTLTPNATGILWGCSAYNFIICLAAAYWQKNVQDEKSRKHAIFTNTLTEYMRHMETIRIYGHNETYFVSAQKHFKEFTHSIFRNDWKLALFRLIAVKGFFIGACLSTVYLLRNDPYKELIFALSYLLIFHLSTEAFSLAILDTRRPINHLKKVKVINEEKITPAPESCEDACRVNINEISGERITCSLPIVEFKNVSFSSGGKDLLSNVSFKIKPGEICQLIGKSGSGKSLLIKLLCGSIKPTSGNIFINGKNINEIGLDKLSDSISLIAQRTSIFHEDCGSASKLQYNVLFGTKSQRLIDIKNGKPLTDEEETICSYTENCLNNMPENLTHLSDGQRQQIGFARAMLEKQIIIFDEATSMMDAVSEEAILRRINQCIVEMKNDREKILLMASHHLKIENVAGITIFIENGAARPEENEIAVDEPSYIRRCGSAPSVPYTSEATPSLSQRGPK